MKWNFLLAISVLVSFLSIPAEAQRPDVDSLASARRLYRELDDLENWCDDVISKIDFAEQRAGRFQRRGEYGRAITEYIYGMQSALDAGEYVNGLMTKSALARGIRNLRNLKRAIGGTSEEPDNLGLRTTLWYASHHADFIRDVATDLDIPHMAQRQRCRGRDCRYDREDEFEQKYIWFIGGTVDLGVEGLRFGARDNNYPIGYPVALLMMMKAAATDAAKDLRESLWRSYYACTIGELNDLARFIDPGDSDYRGQLEDYWYRLKDIANELLENRGRCDDGNNRHSRDRRGPGGPGGPR